MERKEQYSLIFSTSNLLKISLICFTLSHAIRLIMNDISAPVFDKGVLLFCASILICILFIACFVILLYVFFRTIKQIFLPPYDKKNNYYVSIPFFGLFLYAIGYLFLFLLFCYFSNKMNYIFSWMISLPIFLYLYTNLVGVVIVILLKIIKILFLFVSGKKDKSHKQKFKFADFLATKNLHIFNNHNKFNDKLLLVIAMIGSTAFALFADAIMLELFITNFNQSLNHFILFVFTLSLAVVSLGILLFVFIRNINKILFFNTKKEESYINFCSFHSLFSYLTFYAIYYLITMGILLPIIDEYLFKFNGFVAIYYCYAYILNFIGVVILLLLKKKK